MRLPGIIISAVAVSPISGITLMSLAQLETQNMYQSWEINFSILAYLTGTQRTRISLIARQEIHAR